MVSDESDTEIQTMPCLQSDIPVFEFECHCLLCTESEERFRDTINIYNKSMTTKTFNSIDSGAKEGSDDVGNNVL